MQTPGGEDAADLELISKQIEQYQQEALMKLFANQNAASNKKIKSQPLPVAEPVAKVKTIDLRELVGKDDLYASKSKIE